MIPRLVATSSHAMPRTGFFEHLVEAGFRGDIDVSEATRTVYSTDNSIYQVAPAGVLFPRGGDDLVAISKVVSEPKFSTVVLAMRGGGTGTNGQSLSDGIVVDCSRHMNRILEIDPVRRVARVEAGVVKDQLNRALEPYGLFFAPELSTSNRATIGGMINTDACGQGSCVYGKTSNHVIGLRVIFADGTDWWSRATTPQQLAQLQQRSDRVGEICRVLDRIERDNRMLIDQTFPKLNRYLTGYDLAHLRSEDGGLNMNSVLCGSEGTLAMIAEAELNLLPIPAFAALINIRYENFNTALEDARELTAMRVASVETVDEKVLRLAKGDIVWPAISLFFPNDAAGMANGINIVEVLADNQDELAGKIATVTSRLDSHPIPGRNGFTVATSKTDIDAIWTMRKRAVGLLGNVEGAVRPVAFVEDTAVPPENLAAYIREFRELLDGEGLDYGMFGHVDAGVLHVRPALDLTREDHALLVRRVSDGVVALTRKYGGVLWGEHGKGVRSEYVPLFFGDLYPCLQEIKQAFDPFNQLNPGKIAVAGPGDLTKIDEVPLRGSFDRTIGAEIRAAFDNAAYCNGNGACFDFSETSLMCPSFKGSRDRRYSPKGRASLMREWLRLLTTNGIDPRREAERQRSALGFGRVVARAWNSINPANRSDFSHEVRRSMDTCLACKACAGQCPVKVNVPAFRAKFLELYYGRYLRPLKDPLVASIETVLPAMAWMKSIYNAWVGSRIGRRLLTFVGLTALPEMSPRSARRGVKDRGVATATPERILRLPMEERARAVVFVQDAFTTHFDSQVVLDAVDLARRMGFIPFVSALHENGKALHVHGYLGRFARKASDTSSYLNALSEAGATLVGLDPSMTLVYRSEYANLPTIGKAPTVLLPQEWLSRNLDLLQREATLGDIGVFKLFLHCTEQTSLPAAGAQWSAIFASLGIKLALAKVGCCGMAGTFGHEVRNRGLSEAIYALSWSDAFSRPVEGEILMATGYSCRSQVKIMEEKSLKHPLQVINALIVDKSPSLS
ncbi:FAD-binding oxidoreductase [Agrobacterium sp. ICMP 6402]|uniref:D-2-hydroxyglutarate dehydrogenase YdiJ n=1 Tax=Agrobacterium sp. ICMP 6402 TaxID=2292443 RepID=UPI001296DA86|nr:FAD-binding and (Fe-S)-binding domain-containing protein [Agrobacterium sp. ICMP 6402]MQB12311.1 FAD-binding oxidoreductase [Agrobacterium sp. ICMP 6402]